MPAPQRKDHDLLRSQSPDTSSLLRSIADDGGPERLLSGGWDVTSGTRTSPHSPSESRSLGPSAPSQQQEWALKLNF